MGRGLKEIKEEEGRDGKGRWSPLILVLYKHTHVPR